MLYSIFQLQDYNEIQYVIFQMIFISDHYKNYVTINVHYFLTNINVFHIFKATKNVFSVSQSEIYLSFHCGIRRLNL